MNILRRHTLHPLRSRHNPLTRIARICTLSALAMAALGVVSELDALRRISAADKSMIAELVMVMEGRGKLVERTGNYEVHYSVNKTIYEVK